MMIIPLFIGVSPPSKRWLALGFLNHQQHGFGDTNPTIKGIHRCQCRWQRDLLGVRPSGSRWSCSTYTSEFCDPISWLSLEEMEETTILDVGLDVG